MLVSKDVAVTLPNNIGNVVIDLCLRSLNTNPNSLLDGEAVSNTEC